MDWAEDGTHVEWVDGDVVWLEPMDVRHADLKCFLQILIRWFSEVRRPGTVLDRPFLIKLGPRLPARSPDILFLSQEHGDRLETMYLDGPADLAVEIISPESRARDRVEKFREYQQAGVREYWLIDPQHRQFEGYQRGEDGLYRLAASDSEGVYHSVVLPGLWLKVAWLWQEPLPRLTSVLKEWRLV